MAIRLTGFKAIRMGDLAADGGPGTVLAAIGDVYDGGIEITTDDPEEKEFKNEDGSIFWASKKAGKTKIKLSVSDLSADMLTKLVGGAKSGTGDAEVWSLSDFPTGKDQTIEIDTLSGRTLVLNRVNVFGKLSGKLGGESPLLIEITGTLLKPDKAGVAITSMNKTA